MDDTEDLDARLKKSVQALRAWRWMSSITKDPEEVAALLTTEARALIALGRRHPERAKDIGRLIVAYHKLILQMKTAAEATPCPSKAVAA